MAEVVDVNAVRKRETVMKNFMVMSKALAQFVVVLVWIFMTVCSEEAVCRWFRMGKLGC